MVSNPLHSAEIAYFLPNHPFSYLLAVTDKEDRPQKPSNSAAGIPND